MPSALAMASMGKNGIYGAGLLQSERHKPKLTVRIGNEEQR